MLPQAKPANTNSILRSAPLARSRELECSPGNGFGDFPGSETPRLPEGRHLQPLGRRGCACVYLARRPFITAVSPLPRRFLNWIFSGKIMRNKLIMSALDVGGLGRGPGGEGARGEMLHPTLHPCCHLVDPTTRETGERETGAFCSGPESWMQICAEGRMTVSICVGQVVS